MRIHRKNLMVIAGIVWMAAGINIALIGLDAYRSFAGWSLVALVAGSTVVSGFFHVIFGRVVRKQVARISSYEQEYVGVHRFFDLRGYIMMAAMSSLGIVLRNCALVPTWFIAFFYTGLGISLAGAGAAFVLHRVKGADWHPCCCTHGLRSL